ncbi:MAG: molecular chaperone TorD family protein [Acidobacteria bacterium]|nr:molecular chaperone TorD family protein [Acidobacteriota bacterium]
MSGVSAPVASGRREALRSLAPLFAWPGLACEDEVERRIELARSGAEAARELELFAEEICRLPLADREILYTSTFDLAPSCSPYLGVHLFEEGNLARGRLMIGLRSSFVAGGVDPGVELPDHIALVLAFATRFSREEWPDLVRLILLPALEGMERALADTTNPYRHLVSATRRLSLAAAEEGVTA